MNFVRDGGICSIEGVMAAGVREGKNGLALISAKGLVAGVFTRNRLKGNPVILTREVVRRGRISAIVANSGCANAFTGKDGMEDAREMARIAARELGVDEREVAVASTGITGRRLDLELIKRQIREAASKLSSSADAQMDVARAIMTTDTFPKQLMIEVDGCGVAGVAKGAGMIAPDLATMLCFIFTDAELGLGEMREMLHHAVDQSFNMICVDGDTSPNDMVLFVSTGKKRGRKRNVRSALATLCVELAKMIAQDGEGATKFVECRVKGAKSTGDARKVVRAVLSSPLVKSALFGCDPNWGRILVAIGNSGASLGRVSLRIGSGEDFVDVFRNNEPVDSDPGEILRNRRIWIEANLGAGRAHATGWGCDLSVDYVKLNSKS